MPIPPRIKSLAIHLAGALLLLASIWIYAQRQAVPQLRPALTRGGAIHMLHGFGGVMSGNDFLHIYLGSRLLWDGYDPYDPHTMLQAGHILLRRGPLPYVYLPFTGFVMRPISALPYGQAFLAWFLFSHLLMLGALVVGLRALRMPLSWWNLSFGLLVLAASVPLGRSMSAGQLNAPLAFGYALFFYCIADTLRGKAPATPLRRFAGHPAATGALAAALMLFKLSPGILLIYLLWMRLWKHAAWMAVWSMFFMALTVALFGLDVHLKFLPMLRDMGYGRSTWAQFGHAFYSDPANQSFNALFHHLFAQTPQGTQPWIRAGTGLANALTWAASLLVLGSTFWLARRSRRMPSMEKAALGYSLFIFASLLLPSLMWDHYLVQLIFPILALFMALLRDRSIILRILFILGLMIISMDYNFWDESLKEGLGLLAMSAKLWGVLLLLGINAALIIRLRPSQDAENLETIKSP